MCICFFRKTRFAFKISDKINKISYLSNSLQPMLNLKRNRPSHWLIDKLIIAYDTIWVFCCRIETIIGHQFIMTLNRLEIDNFA